MMIYYRIERFTSTKAILAMLSGWSTIELKDYFDVGSEARCCSCRWSTIELKVWVSAKHMVWQHHSRMIYYRIERPLFSGRSRFALHCWWSTIELKARSEKFRIDEETKKMMIYYRIESWLRGLWIGCRGLALMIYYRIESLSVLSACKSLYQHA